MSRRVALVTGAGGFVGRALCASLLAKGVEVVAVVRSGNWTRRPPCARLLELDIARQVLGPEDLAGVDIVFHLAARAHQTRDHQAALHALYWQNNVDPTRHLIRAAIRAGVRRFVYLSSIKALGDVDPGRPWREDDHPVPGDVYGASKLAAERVLEDASRGASLQTVIIRPPLVYGPGVGANFLSLLRATDLRWPLPLGSASAPRSLIFLDNLVDALQRSGSENLPDGATVLHVADASDISVAQLVLEMANRLNRSARLFAFPVSALRLAACLVGQSDQVDRLFRSQRVDSSRIRSLIAWTPPHTLSEGLDATVEWYRREVAA